jgi:hypothetical protein
MALPASVKEQAEKLVGTYCEKRNPAHVRDQMRLSFSVRGSSITLFDERPSYLDEKVWIKMSVAQFRYGEDGKWTLYCADRNSRWHEYWDLDASENLQDLLDEVDDDPTCIFWG